MARAGARFVTTTMPLECVKLAAKVLELTSRSCFGSAYLEHMADNATAGIFMKLGFEDSERRQCEKHVLSGIQDPLLRPAICGRKKSCDVTLLWCNDGYAMYLTITREQEHNDSTGAAQEGSL